MAKQENEAEIAKMNWRNVREVLQKPQTRGESVSPQEKNLREYFGAELFRDLRELAEPKRATETRKELGNVVVLPGVMGSHLSVVETDGEDEDHIWVSLWRLVKGDMKRLKLSPDGKTNSNGETVVATSLIGWYYALALETLQAEAFPYDWRVSVCDTADKLKVFVEENLADGTFDPNKPVHFVAHSMGGLVVRNFVRQHNDLWNKVKGRLVMLGTPNAGSFAAVQTLMGKNSLVKNISAVLPFQSKADWFQVVNSFPGLYQLCPSKLVNPEVYEKSIWDKFPDVAFDVQMQMLPKFHQDLFDTRETTADTNRMTYIAGIGYETPAGLKTLDTGEYDFDLTLDGDGTVPHKLGLLEGITTYYVEGTPHGSLLNNRRVLKAVKDILKSGTTQELTTTKPVIINPRGAKATPVINYELEHLESVARQIRNDNKPDQVIVYDAEKILLRSLLGGKENVDDDLELMSLQGKTRKRKIVELDVRWIFGDITAVDVPVVVVGQYQNVPPGGAGSAVDRKINNLISRAFDNNMLGMDLGQVFTVPLANQKNRTLNPKIETVVVAGMGEFGRFSREDLRYLTMNMTLAILGLGYDTFSTVLIGASIDSFPVERAVQAVWFGISDAVDRLREDEQVKKISLVLVEGNPTRQSQIRNLIRGFKENKTNGSKKPEAIEFENLRITLREPEDGAPIEKIKNESLKATLAATTRMTVERSLEKIDPATKRRERGQFRLSAFTSNAAIPVREIVVNDVIIEQLVDELRYSNSLSKQEEYGKLLHSILMPEDFQSVVDTDKSLVLMMNREASVVPWEMLCFGGGTGRAAMNFGIDLRLSRQFTSTRANVPGAAPALNKQFKALIVADPAREPELQLSGARREGVRLKEFFRKLQTEMRDQIDLQFQVCIGFEECDIVKILNLIFNEEFDLIHFAGHGTFDAEDPSNSGWVFGKDLILSAHEIFRLRRVPRLVFANACFSSGLPTVESNRQVAGLAEAFFERGIENYIGAGWQVSDEHAIKFAQTFYQKTIESGLSLGEALSESRMSISPQHTRGVLPADSTWGAYQHYGNPNTQLVKASEAGAAARSKTNKGKKSK